MSKIAIDQTALNTLYEELHEALDERPRDWGWFVGWYETNVEGHPPYSSPLPPPPPTMTTAEVLADLRERLTKAHYDLLELKASYQPGLHRGHVDGKAKGVALALDYLRAYES